jgi:hypothetical protein
MLPFVAEHSDGRGRKFVSDEVNDIGVLMQIRGIAPEAIK